MGTVLRPNSVRYRRQKAWKYHVLSVTTEGAQRVQVNLQHGISRPELPKLQRLLAGITNTGVNNISSYVPSSDELCVLALGLNYIPESKDISNFEILQAFNEFEETLLASEKPTQHTSDEYYTNPVTILRRKLKQKHRIKYGTDRYKVREPPIIKRIIIRNPI